MVSAIDPRPLRPFTSPHTVTMRLDTDSGWLVSIPTVAFICKCPVVNAVVKPAACAYLIDWAGNGDDVDHSGDLGGKVQ